MSDVVQLPHNWSPRSYQSPLWRYLRGKQPRKRAVFVCHRRGGKDLLAVNHIACSAFERVGAYWHVFPEFKQAKAAIWNGITSEGEPGNEGKKGTKFLDHIPKQLIERTYENEMRIKFIAPEGQTTGSNYYLVGSDNYNCYDSETEVLTLDGWKRFQALGDTDEVASLVGGSLVYQRPIHRIESEYSGEMVRIKSKALDLLVTPNHRFWVKSMKGVYKFKEAKDLSPSGDSIPSKCNWVGRDPDKISPPPIPDKVWKTGKGRICVKRWHREFNAGDWCRLVGFYLAEGSVFSNPKNYRVHLSQKKENGRLWVEGLLQRMGIHYGTHKDGFVIQDKQLWDYFRQFGKSGDKFIPKDIKALSVRHLKALMEGMVIGDGHSCDTYTAYFSTSKKLIDDFQEVAIKCGYSANVKSRLNKGGCINGRQIVATKPIWSCYLRESEFKRLSSSKQSYMSRVGYSGKIYCVDIGGGVIKVRRNGVECWCGNSLVGTNPVGVVMSEYSLQDPAAWHYLSPILAENGGWALFIYTFRGRNHGWWLAQQAKRNPDWFYAEHHAGSGEGATKKPDGSPVITDEEIEKLRAEGIPESVIQSEYYNNPDAPLEGAYYEHEMQEAKKDGRLCDIGYEPKLPVYTSWDIGHDMTVVIFFQLYASEIRIIDCYFKSEESLPHFINVVKSKPYKVYEAHYAPWDVDTRQWSTGKSILDVANGLGLKFKVTPQKPGNLGRADGIEQVKLIFPKLIFNQKNCEMLIEALRGYRSEPQPDKMQYTGENAIGLKMFKSEPLHSWESHFADALRILAWNHKSKPMTDWNKLPDRAEDNYQYV